MARRTFLRGRLGEAPQPMRPPWARVEAEFAARCTRCGECVDACPTGLLNGPRGIFPQPDFAAGHCDFCGRCVDACQPAALSRDIVPPWNLSAAIAPTCLANQGVVCRSCGESCDAGAIRFALRVGGVGQPELDAAACSGCGECLPVCPTTAITIGRLAAQENPQ